MSLKWANTKILQKYHILNVNQNCRNIDCPRIQQNRIVFGFQSLLSFNACFHVKLTGILGLDFGIPQFVFQAKEPSFHLKWFYSIKIDVFLQWWEWECLIMKIRQSFIKIWYLEKSVPRVGPPTCATKVGDK